MTRTRQLVAIMFTDIQGYTALMQKNEQQAVAVREKHRRVFNSTTRKFQGRILQYYGDGTLSTFESAIHAVECAIEMQRELRQEPSIPVRIGIHIADIIVSDEEIIGDGVNVASRIESLAVAGSVLVSERVHDELKNQNAIKATLLNSFKFKNVANPIAIYAISNDGLVVPKWTDLKGKTDSNDGTTGPNQSIAVLAFENMSGDPAQEYFSDGISEEILNSLTQVPELKVSGRTSAFSFKGKNEDIRKIGEQLNVQLILEGSVRKAGNRVRVTAQLINVEDGFHIWSETYDRELEDIFAVQEDIADRIVGKLKLQIKESSESRTQNMEAYELLLKGSYFLFRGHEGKLKAKECFLKATELDPGYAKAHARLGEAYLHHAGINLMTAGEAYTKARASAQTAISLNPREPRAHLVMAFVHLFYDWNWDATRTAYEKAIQYGLPEQNEFITYYHVFLNKDYDRAIGIMQRMVETDPLRVESLTQLGTCQHFSQRHKDALDSFNSALELDPNFSDAINGKGIALGYLGRYAEAIESLEKALELTHGEGLAKLDLLRVKVLMGHREEVLKEMETTEFYDPGDAAELCALMGMKNEAIKWLEKGYRERSVMMVTLKHSWMWDSLRDEPGFIEIYNRMNF